MMGLRTTHTYAILEVSEGTYQEIKGLLSEAGYHHIFHDTYPHGIVMDMSGLAIGLKPADQSVVTERPVPEQPTNVSERSEVRDGNGEGE